MSAAADSTGPAEVAAAVVEAINAQDSARLTALLDPAVEVGTGRSVHAGPASFVAWAAKEYDHLSRRYAIDEYRVSDGSVLALGCVQYVWSDGEEVADSSPIALELDVSGRRLLRLRVHDDVAAARAAFDR